METKITWNEALSFSGTASSGFTLKLGADPAVGGDNDGFRPMELLALSLGGCTGMDVISILKKKRQEVTGFEVRINAEQSPEHPKVFTHILIEYLVEGEQIDPSAVERAIELSSTRYCPVQHMLDKNVIIEHQYQINGQPSKIAEITP
jgi:putative redox protein